jgi:hypothetical protein
MLIGIRLSDLGRRSRWLLAIASLLFAIALAATFFIPQSPRWMLRAWLLAILFLGGYWLSFLADLRGRLGRWQLALASLFGLLAWLLVLAILLLWPQLLGGGPR